MKGFIFDLSILMVILRLNEFFDSCLCVFNLIKASIKNKDLAPYCESWKKFILGA